MEHMFDEVLPPGVTPDADDEALLRDVAAVIAAKHLDDARAPRAEAVIAAERARGRLEAAAATVTFAFHESLEWATEGARSSASWMVSHTGVGRGSAARCVNMAKRLRSCPVTRAALASGRLSLDKARAVALTRTRENAAVFAEHEAYLVDNVRALTAEGARIFLAAWADRASPDGGTARLADAEDRTHLHLSGTIGGYKVDGFLDPVTGAMVEGGLAAELDGWYRSGRLADDGRTRSQLQGEAFRTIFERGMHAGTHGGQPRPLALVLVDADTLADLPHDHPDRRSAPRCEIVGTGPVPVETARRLLCDGDISRVVLRGDSEVLDVGRRHRLATPAIRRGVMARSGGRCELCHLVPAGRCEVHHLDHWHRDGGSTSIERSVLVCHHCHHLVHEDGWSVTTGPGGFQLVAPGGVPARPRLRHHPVRPPTDQDGRDPRGPTGPWPGAQPARPVRPMGAGSSRTADGPRARPGGPGTQVPPTSGPPAAGPAPPGPPLVDQPDDLPEVPRARSARHHTGTDPPRPGSARDPPGHADA